AGPARQKIPPRARGWSTPAGALPLESDAVRFSLTRARRNSREPRNALSILNTERGFGGKPPKKSGFRRHLAGSKMPKETFFTAISRWRVVSRRAFDASGFWHV